MFSVQLLLSVTSGLHLEVNALYLQSSVFQLYTLVIMYI